MNRQLKRLQELYNLPLTTDDIKIEAWNIRGVSGNHFRLIVKGVKPNGKPYDVDDILGCYQALKQAYKTNTAKRNKLNNKLQSVN